MGQVADHPSEVTGCGSEGTGPVGTHLKAHPILPGVDTPKSLCTDTHHTHWWLQRQEGAPGTWLCVWIHVKILGSDSRTPKSVELVGCFQVRFSRVAGMPLGLSFSIGMRREQQSLFLDHKSKLGTMTASMASAAALQTEPPIDWLEDRLLPNSEAWTWPSTVAARGLQGHPCQWCSTPGELSACRTQASLSVPQMSDPGKTQSL